MQASALLITLGACGGGSGGGAQASANCPAMDSPEYTSAIDEYLHDLNPQPLRFLFYASGDSALPDAARSVLEEKGPTYLYPTDPADQKKQLDNLKMKGDAVTLLLLYTGIDTTRAGNTIGFAGRYLDKSDSGKTSPPKSILFQCRDHQWRPAPRPPAPAANSA